MSLITQVEKFGQLIEQASVPRSVKGFFDIQEPQL
jgi:hypothetical protein